MKYIDAEKLKAELEIYEDTAIDAYNPLGEDADFWNGKVVACEDLKTIISLQQEQPEVDLEKEFKKWWDSVASGKVNVDHSMYWYMEKSAEHFYELGLNARKEG